MKITVLDGYTLNPGDLSWDDLAGLGDLTVYERTPADLILERTAGTRIVLTNKTPISAETMVQLPDLNYIGVLATGYNVVDVEAARARGITVTNIPTYGTHSVAQMVIAQVLALCHHVEQHSMAVRQGAWSESPDWCFWLSPQMELYGRTLGVIGFGRIGHQVGRIAAALGMHVQAVDQNQREVIDIPDFEWVTLETLLQTSDVISLNCPLTPETRGIINRDSLRMMKAGALLVNAARGPLVVEADLADALNNGRIGGAALDVLSKEPPVPDNPLLSAKNVLITPHIAWATREARQRLMQIAVQNLRAFLEGQAINVV